MVPLIVPIGSLLMGVALLLLGVGLLNTILALRSSVEGYSATMLGFIMSSYFLGFFIGTYLALPLVKRMGHIRAFACCASMVSVCVLLHQLIVNPYAWMAFRVLTGISLVILYTVVESWLNGQTPAENRGKVFAIYMTVNLGALAAAQQLLIVDPNLTFLLFALASVLVSLSLVPVTWTRLQQPLVSSVSEIKLWSLWKTAPVGVLGSFLSGLAMGSFWGLTAVYASEIGLKTTNVGTFVACAILGGALLQFPLGKFSDSQDRRKALFMISLGGGALAMALAFFSSVGWWLYVMIAGFGGMAFAVYPVAMAHLVDHLEPEDMLSGSSGLLLIHGVGAMLGPLTAGALMQSIAPQSLPAYWAVILFVMAAVSWWYMNTSKAENPDDHMADFIPMVRTTPTALEMLPADEQGELFENQSPVWGNDTSGETDNDDDNSEESELDENSNESDTGDNVQPRSAN